LPIALGFAGVAESAVVGKPFTAQELARKVRLVLAGRTAIARAGGKITPLGRPSTRS